jgi:methylthioxylose transferase
MQKVRLLLAIVPAALLAALAVVLRSRARPLGVRGEWEWLRLASRPAASDVLLAVVAVLLYAGFAALGLRSLSVRRSRCREALAVLALLVASVVVQAVVPIGAPEGYGLARWALVLHLPASTGYYTVAKKQINDHGRFLAEYPEWIRRQDALHVGTHPPGLFLVEFALLDALGTRPAVSRWVVAQLPGTVAAAFRAIDTYDPLPMADRAALGLTAALTVLACAATVVPLYALARVRLSAPAAWSAAVLWPLVPSAVLFQPLPDTAYPLLSVTALALVAHAAASGPIIGSLQAAAAGIVLAVGMQFTLAFLAVGLVVAILLATAADLPPRHRAGLLLATGAGFLGPTLAFWLATGADPFVIWWWNQRNHARFYVEYHRTYALWLLVNPIELALALGIPATVWAIVGFASVRSVPRVSWATLAVLVVLTLSGRSLSEVARLWLPLMPPLLAAAGHGLAQLGAGPATLAVAVAMLGAETLLLEATIQVVYPI